MAGEETAVELNPLRQARKEAELTLVELGRMAEVHVSNLSRIERGLVSPQIETCQRLARSLGRSLDELFPMPDDGDVW